LLSIAWRKALTRRRRVGTLLRRFVQPAEDQGWEIPDHVRTQEQSLADEELRGHLRRLIAGLAPKLRDTLLLATSGNYTYEEVAALQRIPLGTVKWRMSEARRRLKVKLAELGYRHGI
jgi:RNA polymerase sigma-70 factor (ECF subfamily)